jgi:hypothetical protein
MIIVETLDELQILKENISNKTSYWYPMWTDWDKHPNDNELSFVFIRCDGTDYILSHKHTDTLSIDFRGIEEVFSVNGTKWVFQKKKLLQTLKTTNFEVLDIDTAYFLKTHSTIDYRTPFQTLINFYQRNGCNTDVIKYCPILKLGEVIQSILPNFENLDSTNPNFEWYDSKYIPILSKIEKFGIKVNFEKFQNRWAGFEKYISDNGLIYTEYNPYTTTGRPSNRYGGINFSALNKKDGTREVFVSDGIFIQMDYDAYHPRLIGELINYDLPKTSVHQWLADQYGCSYTEGKGITFQLLYGGIPDEFLNIPYFKSVNDYIQLLWEATQKNGYLQTFKRRIPLEWIDTPNPQKLFNYLLQAIETEINVDIIEKLLDLISNTDIRFSLYLYDSFLFDYPIDMDTKTAKEIKDLIENNKYPVKVSWGNDYSKL